MSRRHYSKSRTDAVLAFCGAVVLITIIWRAESKIAETAVSSAFLLAGAVLGIYQGIGHADLRASTKKEESDGSNTAEPVQK